MGIHFVVNIFDIYGTLSKEQTETTKKVGLSFVGAEKLL